MPAILPIFAGECKYFGIISCEHFVVVVVVVARYKIMMNEEKTDFEKKRR